MLGREGGQTSGVGVRNGTYPPMSALGFRATVSGLQGPVQTGCAGERGGTNKWYGCEEWITPFFVSFGFQGHRFQDLSRQGCPGDRTHCCMQRASLRV